MKGAARRPYRMRARADAAAETGRRIVRAMQVLFTELRYDEITVAEIARRAGVTVQTVLRRFGSKDGVFVAAALDARAEIVAQRAVARVGDRAAAVANLFDHYERWGHTSLQLLEQEERLAQVGAMAREGRRVHAEWVARVFAPQLASARGAVRARRRTQLVAVTDVYVWKLLRVDLGLGRAEAEATVRGIVDALCARGGA